MSVERKELVELLQESFDHHEYCGWGDAWERECVESSGLRERILAALENEGKPRLETQP